MKIPYFPKFTTNNLKKTLTNSQNDNQFRLQQFYKILKIFNNPQLKLQNVIHVAGTNGKGSVCNFIKNILIKSGYSVNLYTSPHLINFNERFSLNNKIVTDYELNVIIDEVSNKLKDNFDISFFEASTLFAFLLFNKYPADFNIIEVGLGGRYDATNIFQEKLCSIFTSISLDHIEILGNSIEKIATEKAEIIKNNSAVFTCKQKKSVEKIIINKINSAMIKDNSITLLHVSNVKNFDNNIKPSLIGEHQKINAQLAIDVCKYIQSINYNKINNDTIKNGIENTIWHGRLQKINFLNYKYSQFLLDGAHNEDGIKVLFQYIKQTKSQYKKNIGIFACLQEKNVQNFIRYIENNLDEIFVTNVEIDTLMPKKLEKSENLFKIFNDNKIQCKIIENIENESEINRIILDSKDTRVIIFGSLYFVGKVLEFP